MGRLKRTRQTQGGLEVACGERGKPMSLEGSEPIENTRRTEPQDKSKGTASMCTGGGERAILRDEVKN